MKEILNKLHLSIREFAELYEIPYQTVRQWTVGERRMPEYLKKLIEKDIERRSSGEQIEIQNNTEKNYLAKIIEEENKITVYSRLLTYKEYLKFEEDYGYIEYIKKRKGFKLNYYLLKKI